MVLSQQIIITINLHCAFLHPYTIPQACSGVSDLRGVVLVDFPTGKQVCGLQSMILLNPTSIKVNQFFVLLLWCLVLDHIEVEAHQVHCNAFLNPPVWGQELKINTGVNKDSLATEMRYCLHLWVWVCDVPQWPTFNHILNTLCFCH